MSNTPQNSHTLFLLYEPRQVNELEILWRRQPPDQIGSLVIALSLDIEAELIKKNIPFVSGRNYKQIIPDQLIIEDKVISAFFADSRWGGFVYRSVNLVTVFQFMFRAYWQRIWYYSNLLTDIIQSHPSVKRWVLFQPSEIITDTFGGLAKREINVVIDCSKIIAATKGIEVDIELLTLSPVNTRRYIRPAIFSIKRALFGLLLTGWNWVISYCRYPQRPRLVISDYWRNIGSVIKLLPHAECIFLDRSEIKHIDWHSLWRYRMKFMHITNFLSWRSRQKARRAAQELTTVWQEMRGSLPPVFRYRGYTFDTLLYNAIDDLVADFEKILCQIEGAYSLYENLTPDLVLLRASVSGQTHFSILPLVAKQCGIPSLELQHGLEYLGPGSYSREHAVEYLAVYGSLIKKEFITLGYLPEKILTIGSPRFDDRLLGCTAIDYQSGHQHKKSFTILCIAPDIRPFDIYDTYSAEDYFNRIAKAVNQFKEINLIIKLRSVPAHETILRMIINRAFSQVSHTVAQYEPLSDLYSKTDLVVSGYSTAILEALQFGLPVIIPVLNSVERDMINFHFSQYSHAGLYLAPTTEEISQVITKFIVNPQTLMAAKEAARSFVAQNFSFDNRSAQRCADFITQLRSQ